MSASTLIGVVVVILISIIGYYILRAPGGCTGNVVGPCANVSGPHVKPNSAYLACNIQTGKLDTQCTATCVPPYQWDKATQSCVAHAPGCNANDPTACGGPAAGQCIGGACVCKPGYSGNQCQHSVPCSDKQACGPGGMCDKNGNCVCKPGQWVSGFDGNGHFVMCAECAPGYAMDGNGNCTLKWQTILRKTNNCTSYDAHDGIQCQEFNNYASQSYGPNMGGVSYVSMCDEGVPGYTGWNCHGCSDKYQALCTVTGYQDENLLPADCNCDPAPPVGPRDYHGYQCCDPTGICYSASFKDFPPQTLNC